MSPQPSFAPLSPSWIDDPQPHFTNLRTVAPIYRSAELNCWVVSRHRDVRLVLTDHRRFAADPRRAGLPVPTSADSVQTVDPPGSVAARRALTELLQRGAAGLTDGTLRRLAARELGRLRGAEADLTVATTAFSLAATCALLRMPVPDHDWLFPLSEAIIAGMDGGFRPNALPAAAEAKAQLSQLIEQWLADRPVGDGAPGDLSLSGRLVNSIRVIFHAGYTSLGRFLENASMRLLTDPASRSGYLQLTESQRRRWAVPELLRWTSTVQATTRIAVEPMSLYGRPISFGQPVIALIASANWDETVFAAPDRIDFTRDNAVALGLGAGTHACLGKDLAATCAEIFLTELLGDSSWHIISSGRRRDSATLRGWRTIPVAGSPLVGG